MFWLIKVKVSTLFLSTIKTKKKINRFCNLTNHLTGKTQFKNMSRIRDRVKMIHTLHFWETQNIQKRQLMLFIRKLRIISLSLHFKRFKKSFTAIWIKSKKMNKLLKIRQNIISWMKASWSLLKKKLRICITVKLISLKNKFRKRDYNFKEF